MIPERSVRLESQFRCNGSDGFITWLDNTLQIRATANETLGGTDYDFRVFDCPNEMRDEIVEKNKDNNRSRMVAGYCWPWASKKDTSAMDIVLPEYGFAMQWNLTEDGSLWVLKPNSVEQIGCIHTCQGLEVDHVGVIIGPDLIVRDGCVITDASKRAKHDKTIKGYKSMLRENYDEAERLAEIVINNTYRTLMTRGQKGCFVFSTDLETFEWFKSRI